MGMPFEITDGKQVVDILAALMMRDGIHKRDGSRLTEDDLYRYNSHGELSGLAEVCATLGDMLRQGKFAPAVVESMRSIINGAEGIELPEDDTMGIGREAASILWQGLE